MRPTGEEKDAHLQVQAMEVEEVWPGTVAAK
jgi:hypothetical protein